MITGDIPFKKPKNRADYLHALLNEDFVFPSVFLNHSKEVRDLISKCLIKDPNKRITTEEILNHPWLRDFKEETILPMDYINSSKFFSANTKMSDEAIEKEKIINEYFKSRYSKKNSYELKDKNNSNPNCLFNKLNTQDIKAECNKFEKMLSQQELEEVKESNEDQHSIISTNKEKEKDKNLNETKQTKDNQVVKEINESQEPIKVQFKPSFKGRIFSRFAGDSKDFN